MKEYLDGLVRDMYLYQARMVNGAGSVEENIWFQRQFEETIKTLEKIAATAPTLKDVIEFYNSISGDLASLCCSRKKIEAIKTLFPSIAESCIDTEKLDAEIRRIEALRESWAGFVSLLQIQEMIGATKN